MVNYGRPNSFHFNEKNKEKHRAWFQQLISVPIINLITKNKTEELLEEKIIYSYLQGITTAIYTNE